MQFLKKLLLAFIITGLAGSVALLWLIKYRPVFKPCEPFETSFGKDTLKFPIEGAEVKASLEGMKYDTLPPYFLYLSRPDTLVRAHFRAGYETGKFNKNGKDLAIRRNNNKSTEDYDKKGIYAYSFIINDSLYQQTFTDLERRYGNDFQIKTSVYDRISYSFWQIGPCHHLLLFNKKPFTRRHLLNPEKVYTYILFVYNLSEKEINDVVETDGTIRNDIF